MQCRTSQEGEKLPSMLHSSAHSRMGIFHPVLSVHHTPAPIVTVTNQGDAEGAAHPGFLPSAPYTAPPARPPPPPHQERLERGFFSTSPPPSDRHKNNPHRRLPMGAKTRDFMRPPSARHAPRLGCRRSGQHQPANGSSRGGGCSDDPDPWHRGAHE